MESSRSESKKERFLRFIEVPIDDNAGYKNDVSALLRYQYADGHIDAVTHSIGPIGI